MTTVLVTGAAGLTGGAIAATLAARGHEVIGMVRDPSRRLPAGVTAVLGDCADEGTMEPLLRRAEALVHVAGIALAPALIRSPAIRVPRSVLVVSTAAVHSRHRASTTIYRAAERAVLTARPDAVVVRPTMIYGSERDRNVHRVIAFVRRFRMLPVVDDGRARLQPVHFRDLAAVVVALTDHTSIRPVEVGGGDAPTIMEAGSIIFAALGLTPRFIRLPLVPTLAAAKLIDQIARTRLRERIARTTEDRTVDNSRVIELTGIQPRTFREGVTAQVAGFD